MQKGSEKTRRLSFRWILVKNQDLAPILTYRVNSIIILCTFPDSTVQLVPTPFSKLARPVNPGSNSQNVRSPRLKQVSENLFYLAYRSACSLASELLTIWRVSGIKSNKITTSFSRSYQRSLNNQDTKPPQTLNHSLVKMTPKKKNI